jgi:hypothetical protein
VTEIGKTAIGATNVISVMKGGMTTGEEMTVVLVEMIIVTEREAQIVTTTGKGHGVTRTIIRIDVTTEKTGSRLVEGAKTANVLGRLIVGRLRPRMQSLSPKGSAKRPVGMLQLQGTSNIPLCKPSKQVGGKFLCFIYLLLIFCQAFSTFLVPTVVMDRKSLVSAPILLSQLVSSRTPTLLVNPVVSISAASPVSLMRIT